MSNAQLFDVDEQQQLFDTQDLRLRIVKELTKDGIPESKDDRNFLLETMKDIDKSVYTKTRIKVSSKAVDEQKDSNRIIAELLKKHTVTPQVAINVVPTLDKEYRVTDPVQGETLIGLESLSYETFITQ